MQPSLCAISGLCHFKDGLCRDAPQNWVDWIITLFSSSFSHLDNHHLWDPNEFAVSCFRIIMYSIQVRCTSSDM